MVDADEFPITESLQGKIGKGNENIITERKNNNGKHCQKCRGNEKIGMGVDIKKRSPFKYTFVAELANDWIGYLPDREAHHLGGYQTWMGLHSYAEPGTGERVADEVVAMLKELETKQ